MTMSLFGAEEAHFSSGGDDLLVFFLCTFAAFYLATALLETPGVLLAVRNLISCSMMGFMFLCTLVTLGWIATMESILQQFVPQYFISSWGVVVSLAFTTMT